MALFRRAYSPASWRGSTPASQRCGRARGAGARPRGLAREPAQRGARPRLHRRGGLRPLPAARASGGLAAHGHRCRRGRDVLRPSGRARPTPAAAWWAWLGVWPLAVVPGLGHLGGHLLPGRTAALPAVALGGRDGVGARGGVLDPLGPVAGGVRRGGGQRGAPLPPGWVRGRLRDLVTPRPPVVRRVPGPLGGGGDPALAGRRRSCPAAAHRGPGCGNASRSSHCSSGWQAGARHEPDSSRCRWCRSLPGGRSCTVSTWRRTPR